MSEAEKLVYLKNIFENMGQSIIFLKLKGAQVLNEFKSEINLEQFIVLNVIYSNNNICQRDLSEIVLKDRSNTSRIINVLENKGCIDRLIGTKNNRLVKRVLITEKGKKIIEKEQKNLNEAILKPFNELSEQEINVLLESTEKIKNSLKKTVSIQV